MRTNKRNIDDFVVELDSISTTISALAYAIEGHDEYADLSKTSVTEILFGLANHIDRILFSLTAPPYLNVFVMFASETSRSFAISLWLIPS